MRPLLIGLLLTAAACSSALPVDEYAAAVQDLGREYEVETTALQSSLHDQLQTEIRAMERDVDGDDPAAVAAFAEEALAVTALRTRVFFAAVGDALGRYRGALIVLDPPDDVAAAHRDFLTAIDAVLAGLPELLDRLSAVTTFDDIDAAVNGSGYGDAQPRFSAACRALETALRDTGTAANVRCPS